MRKTTAWVLLVVLIAGLAGWYFNARKPVGEHPSVIPTPEVAVVQDEPPAIEHPIENLLPSPAAVEEAPAPEPEPLPPLQESDSTMALALEALLDSARVSEWFITEQFVNRVVATVDGLPGRQVAPLVWPLKKPAGKFLAVGDAEELAISPDNAARYRPYVEMAQAVDLDTLVSVYVRYYPLFQQAYEELGYPGGYFNDRVIEVIDHLLQAPEPAVSPRLVKPEAVYLYADEDLEALSAGQKLLLRIGSDNGLSVRARLVELRAALTRQGPG